MPLAFEAVWRGDHVSFSIEAAVRVVVERLDAADRRARCRQRDARVYCPDCGIRTQPVGDR